MQVFKKWLGRCYMTFQTRHPSPKKTKESFDVQGNSFSSKEGIRIISSEESFFINHGSSYTTVNGFQNRTSVIS